MFDSIHKLQVGSQILERLILLALIVQIPEIELEVLLRVNRGHNHESALRRPVNGIAVLLVERADVLEVAGRITLRLLWAEEGDGRLWWYSSTRHDFTSCDDDESIALWLPCEVNDGVLERIDDLDWNVLLGDAEDFQVRSHGLLRLGVPVDFDT